MDNKDLDEIFTGLLTVFPLFRKKISRIGDEILINKEISRGHVNLLEILREKGPCTMTELGRVLSVSKPNITTLVDKLVGLEMVKRTFDENDRRLIYIELTDSGRDFLSELMETMKVNFGESLLKFTDDELVLFKETLINMKRLIEIMED